MNAEQGINNTNKNFIRSFNEGNASGVSECYTEDGWFMVPNAETFVGRDAIQGAIQGLIDAGVSRIELKTSAIEDFGQIAIEHGEYALYADENLADRGRFMVQWTNVNGTWLLHRDIINSLLPTT